MGARKFLHLRFRRGNKTMAELVTRGNHAQLQHDDKVTVLHDNRGKRSPNVSRVDNGGLFPKQI